MDRRLAVSLVLTVVVLGVSFAWLLGGGTGAVDEPGSTTPAPTESTDENRTVDGFTRAAVQRHTAVLARTNYRVAYRENGTGRPAFSRQVRSSIERRRLSATIRRGNLTVDRYVTNGSLYERQTENGTAEYSGPRNVSSLGGFAFLHQRGTGPDRLRTLALVGNYTDAGTVTRDGRRLDRYTVDGLGPSASPNGTLRRIEGTTLIDQRGIVRSANLTLRIERDGRVRETTVRYRVVATGSVAVQRPPWVDDATAQTTSSSG